jgi:hypothetical protein
VPCRRSVVAVLACALLSCTGDGDDRPSPDAGQAEADATASTPPTVAGGIELPPVDPATVYVGDDLAFGAVLPSEAAASGELGDEQEVASVGSRRVYTVSDARLLGDVLVLQLRGAGFFDESVLAGWQRGLVEGLAGAPPTELVLAGEPGLAAAGDGGSVAAFRDGDVFVVATASTPEDAALIAGRMREARRRGDESRPDPATPMRPLAPSSLFVAVPAVSFVPFPPPEEEPPPLAPVLAGATGADGRIGAIGGERRATVWVYALDPATYPSAEALQPALGGLVSTRAGGAPAADVELADRVVAAADGGDAGSARAFRHGNVAVLVEGADPADLDAIVTAWTTALGPP